MFAASSCRERSAKYQQVYEHAPVRRRARIELSAPVPLTTPPENKKRMWKFNIVERCLGLCVPYIVCLYLIMLFDQMVEFKSHITNYIHMIVLNWKSKQRNDPNQCQQPYSPHLLSNCFKFLGHSHALNLRSDYIMNLIFKVSWYWWISFLKLFHTPPLFSPKLLPPLHSGMLCPWIWQGQSIIYF